MSSETVSSGRRHKADFQRQLAPALREAGTWLDRWGVRGLAVRYRHEAERVEREAKACEAAAPGRDA